jgi:hypothetical protein
MSQDHPRRPQKNAGAFLGPDLGGGGMIPVPMHTLSDDYADRPTYPPDERVPESALPSRLRACE